MKVVFAFIALLVGLVIGLMGAFVQAQRWLIGSFALPWGIVVTLLVLLIAIRGGVWLVQSRIGGWAMFAGWLIATVAMSAETSSGDMALSGGGRQMTYLVCGVIFGAAAATIRLPIARDTGELNLSDSPHV